VLALLLLTCGVFYSAVSVNAHFLSVYNLINVQTQFATLALVSFAQLFAITTGEIDFSVGPLAGFVVVLASYWMPAGAPAGALVAASLAIVVLTSLIGLAQGLIIVALSLPSIVVTLVSFFALQGLSLSLRPLPGGPISDDLVDLLLGSWGYLGFATLVVAALAGALEFVLFRTRFGISLRAVGSDRDSAHKLGVKRTRIVPLTFAADGALAGAAGLLLAATVGVGSGTAGVNFTLMSITAVVLGGAVITGGCGAFVSTLFGALLVQATMSAHLLPANRSRLAVLARRCNHARGRRSLQHESPRGPTCYMSLRSCYVCAFG
jgi:ribose transport system ATP-binding protein